jgi:hypothetical protein
MRGEGKVGGELLPSIRGFEMETLKGKGLF